MCSRPLASPQFVCDNVSNRCPVHRFPVYHVHRLSVYDASQSGLGNRYPIHRFSVYDASQSGLGSRKMQPPTRGVVD
jgi:hypothetical protein